MSALREAAARQDGSFNDAGLAPAVAQPHDTRESLMTAWMNRRIKPPRHLGRKRFPQRSGGCPDSNRENL